MKLLLLAVIIFVHSCTTHGLLIVAPISSLELHSSQFAPSFLNVVIKQSNYEILFIFVIQMQDCTVWLISFEIT